MHTKGFSTTDVRAQCSSQNIANEGFITLAIYLTINKKPDTKQAGLERANTSSTLGLKPRVIKNV